LIRSLRRATGYIRLYGPAHPLCAGAEQEAALAATRLVGTAPARLIGYADDTLFVDGEPAGLLSLQYNAYLRELAAAGIETIVLAGEVDPAEIADLARFIAGTRREPGAGRTVRVNSVKLETGIRDRTPLAGLRGTYARSLDALRRFGHSLQEGTPASLDQTATVVKELLDRSLANPAAALLLSTVKSHHEYTFYHSVNTSILSVSMGRMAGLPYEDQVLLGLGAMLHDIGKTRVPVSILQSPGRLDSRQWEEIRRHPQLGAEAILAAAAPGEELSAVVALEHHARYDGSGYPRLVYHDHTVSPGHSHPLHFFSRLVAVADTYDAITTRRSYRRAEPPTRALQVLVDAAGTSYDPDFVLAFASMMGMYPPGSFLRLVTGEVVMVTEPSGDPDEVPTAVMVRDGAGNDVRDPEPVPYGSDQVVQHLAASALGFHPAEILERIEIDA
jgi:HD-GYP domain-containing protein (c-di-GMP phosphodiesterase class II)